MFIIRWILKLFKKPSLAEEVFNSAKRIKYKLNKGEKCYYNDPNDQMILEMYRKHGLKTKYKESICQPYVEFYL